MGQSPRYRAMGAASSVADMTTSRRSGRAVRLQAAQQGQRQIAFQMPLVKLIQHHGVHASELRIGNQTAREDAFGQETKPRARACDFFEANLISDGLAQPFAQLLRHSAGSHCGRRAGAAPAPALAREPAMSNAGGTRVVFPAPGGASITRLGDRPSDSRIAGSRSSIGSRETVYCNRPVTASSAAWPAPESSGSSTSYLIIMSLLNCL